MVRAAGTDLHWLEVGTGPPLVLLHGLSDSHRTWSRVAPLLARTHRVLMPDLPGHGHSGRPDASYSLAWHARAIAEWLDGLSIERADLVGHSYGGGVAQWLLLMRRDRVRRLALVAPGGLGRGVHWALRLASLPHVVERVGQPFMSVGTRVALRLMHARFDDDESDALGKMNARDGSARALARTVRDVIDLRGQTRSFWDHAHRLHDLPPIAVFWGERDGLIPAEHAETFAQRVDGVRVTVFSACGHFPHREQPEVFARALREFLEDPAHPPARVRPPVLARPRAASALGRLLTARAGGWSPSGA